MKKVLLTLSLFVASLNAGCSDPCDALAEVCTKCKDTSIKNTCESAVAGYRSLPVGSGTSCQAVLDAKTFGSCQ